MEMKVRFFDPARIYKAHKDELDAAIQDVLGRGDLILRKDVEEFEGKLAEFVGTKYAVGVASGTDALILSLRALDIGLGDEVLVPSYTFRATVEAVCHVGAIPVLYDYDGVITFSEHTKAFIPAYIAGYVPAAVESVILTAKSAGIAVVEDACQAIGAAPVRGNTACYSFYPAKILGCFGDGGAIATNDEKLYDTLKIMRNHFKGDWKPVGYNSRLDNLQAAILNVMMKHLPENVLRRRAIARQYDAALFGVEKPITRYVYQDYIVTFDGSDVRDKIHEYLGGEGIETLKNEYPFPEVAPKKPLALDYESRSLRLPCNQTLTETEVSYTINKFNSFW